MQSKGSEEAMLVLDKIVFQQKFVKENQRHFVMKISIHSEDINIVNIHASNNRANKIYQSTIVRIGEK